MAHPVSTMAYPDRFHVASAHVQPLLEASTELSNEIKLALYALYQQATVGPCDQPKPWGWNAANNARWQAWKELGDLNQMEAMRLYVRTLDEEAPGWVEGIDHEAAAEPIEPLAPVTGSDGTVLEESANGPEGHRAEDPIPPPSPTKKTAHVSHLPPPKHRSVAEVVVEGSWVSPYIASPRRPAPRYEHATALLGSRMVVLGGCYSARYLNDVWALDLEALGWSQVVPAGGPEAALPPLAGAAAAAWKGSVLVVGGHAKARAPGPHLAVRALDATTGDWHELGVSWAPRPTAEEDGEAPRPLPAPRGGHTLTALGGRLWVFGGEDTQRRALNELLVLDPVEGTWTAPETKGAAPSPRTAHVAVAWRDRYLLIFGGGSVAHCFGDLHVLDTETLEWRRVEATGPAPPPRAGHAAALLGTTWYVIGGGNNASGCNDMYALDLSSLGSGGGRGAGEEEEEEEEAPGWTLVGRTPPESAVASEGLSLLAVPMAGCLVSFGGYNGRYNAAVHVYRPEGYVVVKSQPRTPAAEDAGAGAGEPRVENGSAHEGPPAAESGWRSEHERAASRREALVAQESAAQELSLVRRQLAATQAALAESERRDEEHEAELERQRGVVIRLEVEIAELKGQLSRMGDLETELQSYREEAMANKRQEASARKGAGLWGFISGADSQDGE